MIRNLTKENRNHPNEQLDCGEELVGRDENQYLHLIQEILTEGVMEEGRNGFTKSPNMTQKNTKCALKYSDYGNTKMPPPLNFLVTI